MQDYEASPLVMRAIERATQVNAALCESVFGEVIGGHVPDGVSEQAVAVATGIPAGDIGALADGRTEQMLRVICNGQSVPAAFAGTATQMLMLGWFIRDEQAREDAAA